MPLQLLILTSISISLRSTILSPICINLFPILLDILFQTGLSNMLGCHKNNCSANELINSESTPVNPTLL